MNMEITKREILASVAIVLILLAIGFGISGGISDGIQEQNEVYTKALKIDNREMFDYGISTNVGNAFTVFEVVASSPQSIPELSNQYISIKKVKQKYVMKTKTVTKTRTVPDGNGGTKTETYTETETYWEWDTVGRENWATPTVMLNGLEIEYGRLSNLPEYQLDLNSSTLSGNYDIRGSYLYESSKVRYKYYVVETSFSGSMYIELGNHTIQSKTISLYKGYSPEELYENHKSSATGWLIFFWVFWIVLIGGAVFGFYYLDNRWLHK